MNILITGGGGYLGGRLIDYLSNNNENNLIIITSKNRTNTQNTKYFNINWNNQSEIDYLCNNIDVVIHLVGLNAKSCENNYALAIDTNVLITSKLLISAINHKVKKFIFLSTAHIYRSPLLGKISENTLLTNKHPYASTKKIAEDIILDAYNKKKIDINIIRLSNSFGTPMDLNSDCWMLIFNDFCKQATLTSQIKIHSRHNIIRNYVTISDLCMFINYLIYNNTYQLPIINFGGNKNFSIIQVANLVKKRFKFLLTKM